MLEPKASRFYQCALQSGLIDEASLDACWAMIPPEKRAADAVDRRLARQTITAGKLTLWQAQQVLSGRSSGFRIDKYVLLDLIGRGGMGRVYLAKDVRLNRLVALKILSQERMNNPRAIARFQREAKVGAQLQHENLVRVYDEGEDAGVRYLVMEYIEGKNIGQLIGELGAIRWPTAARLARQVALGLDHARLKELIHRDVNPCNILVTKEGVAKLTDLGLAIDLNDHDNVTRDGATVGTFDYVSPEQARHSRSVDTRADLYSLGCTLYHMIAGRVPFPVASLPEKLYAHQLHEPDPLGELVPGVPEGLVEVIARLMRKLPEDRYQTPHEVAQALEPYSIEAGWTTTSAASPSNTSMSVAASVAGRTTTNGSEATPVMEDGPGTWPTALNLDLGPGVALGSVSGAVRSVGSPSLPGVGDSFFPLDLGPDEPLLESRKSNPRRSGTPNPDRPNPRVTLIVAGAAVLIAVAVVSMLATLALFGNGLFGRPNDDPIRGWGGGKSAQILPPARGDIVVRFRDGSSEVAKTLIDAIGAASNQSGGEILLAGGTTFRLSNDKPVRVPDGNLVIRAADTGARPVLELNVKGPQPMFVVFANLTLHGLTVVVRYETPSDVPIFQAERELTLERCTFRAIGPAEGSRLVVAEGRKSTVEGCLFEGFETTIDILAKPGIQVALTESIFLSARPAEEAIGRAVRIASMYGSGLACKLSTESCSVRAGTFLEVSKFVPDSPIELDLARSAFLVKTLLNVDVEKAPIGLTSPIRWKALDNRYQVTGGPWANYTGSPTNLDTWTKLTGETGAKAEPLKLAKEPPDPATPKDCALLAEDGKPVGADPAMVGPD